VTTLLDRHSPMANSASAASGSRGNSRLPTSTRRRKPLVALVSLVLVCASIAVFGDLYASTNHQASVLIVTETIEQGQPIMGSQLGQAEASISGGITPIPVSDASELSGRRAAVTIPAGSLLTPGDVTDSQPIASGDAVVGLALKDGQLPATGLQPGEQVIIVQTASPGTPLSSLSTTNASSTSGSQSSGPAVSTGVLVPQATVFDVGVPPSNSSSGASLLVSVEVSSTLAAAVSTAAAADQVSLVLLPASASTSSSSSTTAPAAGGRGSDAHKKGGPSTTGTSP
jgi:hypothetical protein